jgi:hypothetical protein
MPLWKKYELIKHVEQPAWWLVDGCQNRSACLQFSIHSCCQYAWNEWWFYTIVTGKCQKHASTLSVLRILGALTIKVIPWTILWFVHTDISSCFVFWVSFDHITSTSKKNTLSYWGFNKIENRKSHINWCSHCNATIGIWRPCVF